MALLNPPDILPEAMRYLVRALLALRQSHADQDELIGLVAPSGLTEAMKSLAADATDTTDAEPEDPKRAGFIIAEASLGALRSLGVVEQDDGRIALSAAIARRWKKPSDVTTQEMCQVLLDAALQAADPGAPYGEPGGSNDLTQAVILLHNTEQPLHPFDRLESSRSARIGGHAFAEWESLCCGLDRKTWPVPNSPQWLPFRRWAPYLGLARPVGTTGIIPDASEALIKRLPGLEPGDYHIQDFVKRCAQAVPILDGGTLRVGLEIPDNDGEASVLSGGLSVSLLQLEADGFVTMESPKSDTDRESRMLRLRPDRSADRLVGTVTWHATSARRGAQ
jgi:hypothetical protein